MICEVKLSLESVTVRLSVPFKKAEIAQAREDMLAAIGREYDKAMKEAKTEWLKRKK